MKIPKIGSILYALSSLTLAVGIGMACAKTEALCSPTAFLITLSVMGLIYSTGFIFREMSNDF